MRAKDRLQGAGRATRSFKGVDEAYTIQAGRGLSRSYSSRRAALKAMSTPPRRM